jgi:hypothetical protein
VSKSPVSLIKIKTIFQYRLQDPARESSQRKDQQQVPRQQGHHHGRVGQGCALQGAGERELREQFSGIRFLTFSWPFMTFAVLFLFFPFLFPILGRLKIEMNPWG